MTELTRTPVLFFQVEYGRQAPPTEGECFSSSYQEGVRVESNPYSLSPMEIFMVEAFSPTDIWLL